MTTHVNACAIAGNYIGRNKVRPGSEALLAPVERKRMAKGEDAVPLELKTDGTFKFKKNIEGSYEVQQDRILLEPELFNGETLESMRSAADESGRTFGLSWLFAPFELLVQESNLIQEVGSGLVYIEFVRGD